MGDDICGFNYKIIVKGKVKNKNAVTDLKTVFSRRDLVPPKHVYS